MAKYLYKAQNIEGAELNGEIECKDELSLYSILREKGYYLLNWKKEYPIKIRRMFNKISKKELSILCKQFSTIINSGISITKALELLSIQSVKPILKDSLNKIRMEVEKGKSLADSFKLFKTKYPILMINMIRIGEHGGNLDIIFQSLSNYYEREYTMVKKIKSALAYPILLSIVTILITALLMLKIIPSFANTLGNMGQKLPKVTEYILNLSMFFRSKSIYILITVISMMVFLRFFLRIPKGKRIKDGLLMKIPIAKNIYRKYIEAKFIRCMGMLLESGNTVFDSLQLSKLCSGNIVIKEQFSLSIDEIMKGKSILEALKKVEIFDPIVTSMIAVGEETGTLAQMFTKAGDVVDEDIKNSMDRLTALLEPIMIVFLAIIIGVIMFSIMMPMINIMDNLK